ncbi:MAG: photosystem II stability/assembly factor-like uncharacterized protein [Crocinitomicaceae bacterium]|jgi:photosystem II stability/assembly factor-like uncharacterized protein
MKILISALICSVFLGLDLDVNAQSSTKKYIKKNSNAPITVYGDSNTYSRGLYIDTGLIYLGNSNGAIFQHDTDTEQGELVLKFPRVTEIRDIESSGDYIYAMQSGTDGKLVKINKQGPVGFVEYPEWKGVFFDAIDFNGDVGFILGDPVNGKFSLFHTKDGGKNWTRCEGAPSAYKGEAAFAASGTNVRVMNDSTYMFISGGMRSNYYCTKNSGKTWTKVELPYYPGETIGAYSMCFMDEKIGVIVGGDYTQPSLKMNTTYYTYDGGESWMNSMYPPRGYRSCVYFVNGVFYACGKNGIDFSMNNGKEWTAFANGAYFSLNSIEGKLIATMKHGKYQTFDLIK